MSTVSEEVKERVLSYPQVAHALKAAALDKSEWAGFPMPVKGVPLRVEKRYPYKGVEKLWNEESEEDVAEASNFEYVNGWFSNRYRGNINVYRDKRTGKSFHFLEAWNGGQFIIGTMMASEAWLIEAEAKAIEKLAELIPHHLFRAYLLTGTFLQSSKRSKITYVFRKLRPTVALKADERGQMRMLCTLCLHPIGYYEGTWAGCMVPTDDVVAHLMLMRGDEHLFWKMANQHHVTHPQSAL